MNQPTAGEVTLAVMFVDICNSTGLYAQHGDVLALAMVRGCLDELQAIVQGHGGQVIQDQGDGLLCAFDVVDNAFRAALAIQNSSAPAMLPVHAGLNVGPVIPQGGNVFGDAVHLAKRLAEEAKPNEFLLSVEVIQGLTSTHHSQVRALGEFRLKGIAQPVVIYLLVVREEEATTHHPTTFEGSNPPRTTLILEWNGHGCLLRDPVQGFVVGREVASEEGGSERGATVQGSRRELLEDPGRPRPATVNPWDGKSKFVVNHPYVSRHHATIETRGGKFFWLDRSTNGTYVVDAQGRTTVLRRGGVLQLSGVGRIALGGEPKVGVAVLGYREVEE
ncbi:MAG: FHA domain-containing protein [Candidatus Competibacterales bacterium]